MQDDVTLYSSYTVTLHPHEIYKAIAYCWTTLFIQRCHSPEVAPSCAWDSRDGSCTFSKAITIGTSELSHRYRTVSWTDRHHHSNKGKIKNRHDNSSVSPPLMDHWLAFCLQATFKAMMILTEVVVPLQMVGVHSVLECSPQTKNPTHAIQSYS